MEEHDEATRTCLKLLEGILPVKEQSLSLDVCFQLRWPSWIFDPNKEQSTSERGGSSSGSEAWPMVLELSNSLPSL
ncbi:hypothetical protein ACH5RR_023348 [Cinchona calisaya]|uniref:Uncharacterized protein n=1 Tax=Cinchona calisaya TaxID=153742 RepID=A0ABD2ZCA5_9GENT